MKRRGLFLVTLVTLLFSGICMARAGWFNGPPSGRSAARLTQARGQARAFDPMASQAAWRYRRGQPSNWRSVLLYR
ncbi:MAG TPA: hypothetical protein VEL76_26685 [Gemmataceae bacterium]|nr:hypothetical protein [Gemmataceae bacterium]